MTTEQNQPEASQGDAQLPQQGQGQGQHRKRRRRRKNKGGAQAEGQGAPQQAQQSQPRQQQSQPQKAKSSSQNRYFQKNNSNGSGYGNGNGNGNGGPRRKTKQKKQQVFVGPMDHSYRGSNGNVADSPSSSMDMRMVNGNVGSYGNDYGYYEPPPAVIREDAPTRIYCFIEDLFFLAKIQEISKKTGVKVAFVKAEKEVLAKLTDGNEEERPALLVFDLNNANAKPLTTIPKLRAKLKKGKTSIVGFLSHVQGDLKIKAVEAGCDTVMPRSAFSQNLPNLMRRYGLVDEEEEQGQMVN